MVCCYRAPIQCSQVGGYKRSRQLGVGHKTLWSSYLLVLLFIAQNMQCQRVFLLVLGLVYMVHARPPLQYKLLSGNTGQFVKLHSNGQVTADALRVGKCVEVSYSFVRIVLAFAWSPFLFLSFTLFLFFVNAWLLAIIAISACSLYRFEDCDGETLFSHVQMLAVSR